MLENKDKVIECLRDLIDIDKLFEYDENVIISLLNEAWEIIDVETVLKKAAEYGYVQVVEILLKDNRVNPAVDNNYAIRYAARNGHAKVVELLLKDKRVNPSAEKNYAIRSAAKRGYIKIVKMLVEAIEKNK